jgi:hypothetical protein
MELGFADTGHDFGLLFRHLDPPMHLDARILGHRVSGRNR